MTTAVATPVAVVLPTLLTAEEFAWREDNHRVELVKGVVEVCGATPLLHGYVCSNASCLLGNFVEANGLGRVMTCHTWVQTERNPDTIRGTDVCFFSYERLPRGEIPEGILDQVPELVIEVRSPSDRWKNVMEKMIEYLDAGVLVVIDIIPESKSVSVYRNDNDEHLHKGDVLTLPDILPGFAVPVEKFFN